MTDVGYDWEAVKVTTDDDYILTTFHILGKTGEARNTTSAGSVLIQHGDQEDGTSWMSNYHNSGNTSFHLQLVDAGYDVWIGNNRGTMYSWGHKTYDAATDNEYWNWTWADMGVYDDRANITAIKAATGEDKIFYIGYSQGTGQMHYGLTHDDNGYYGENLHKIVHMAPCFVMNAPDAMKLYYTETVAKMESKGFYSINGPNWDTELPQICDEFGKVICEYFTHITGSQGQSVKSEQYWIMNGLEDRFQEFEDNWPKTKETDLIDVSKINTVPMGFFIGSRDNVCPRAQAESHISQITAETEIVNVEGEGHMYFASRACDDWFMSRLLDMLVVPSAAEFLQ